MKLERGFDNFIPLKIFNDDGNGFLVDDTCVFGAEVFVCKERSTGEGECLRMIKDPIMYKHTSWITGYSKLGSECRESNIFIAGSQKWYTPVSCLFVYLYVVFKGHHKQNNSITSLPSNVETFCKLLTLLAVKPSYEVHKICTSGQFIVYLDFFFMYCCCVLSVGGQDSFLMEKKLDWVLMFLIIWLWLIPKGFLQAVKYMPSTHCASEVNLILQTIYLAKVK